MKKSIGTLKTVIVLLALNFIGKAAATAKCTVFKSGGYFDGVMSPRKDNILSSQDCQNLCENDAICYGWQYQSVSSSCYLQTSISTFYTDASYVSGVCIGPDAKVTCKENLSDMYYDGAGYTTINNVATVNDCMTKCNGDSTCLAWSYSGSKTTCWTQSSILAPRSGSGYQGGACIKKQPPYPAITLDDFRKQVLERHNVYRRKHGSADLTLDDELNTIAQQYAQKLADTNTFQHSGNTYHGEFMGENIYKMSGTSQPLYLPGSDSVKSWYNEVEFYNYTKPGFSPSTGHFTQAIWNGTKIIGAGRAATADNGTLIVVTNYYPGGNMGGAFQTNVLQPI